MIWIYGLAGQQHQPRPTVAIPKMGCRQMVGNFFRRSCPKTPTLRFRYIGLNAYTGFADNHNLDRDMNAIEPLSTAVIRNLCGRSIPRPWRTGERVAASKKLWAPSDKVLVEGASRSDRALPAHTSSVVFIHDCVSPVFWHLIKAVRRVSCAPPEGLFQVTLNRPSPRRCAFRCCLGGRAYARTAAGPALRRLIRGRAFPAALCFHLHANLCSGKKPLKGMSS